MFCKGELELYEKELELQERELQIAKEAAEVESEKRFLKRKRVLDEKEEAIGKRTGY